MSDMDFLCAKAEGRKLSRALRVTITRFSPYPVEESN